MILITFLYIVKRVVLEKKQNKILFKKLTKLSVVISLKIKTNLKTRNKIHLPHIIKKNLSLISILALNKYNNKRLKIPKSLPTYPHHQRISQPKKLKISSVISHKLLLKNSSCLNNKKLIPLSNSNKSNLSNNNKTFHRSHLYLLQMPIISLLMR